MPNYLCPYYCLHSVNGPDLSAPRPQVQSLEMFVQLYKAIFLMVVCDCIAWLVSGFYLWSNVKSLKNYVQPQFP